IALLALFLAPTTHGARPQVSAASKTLLDAANRDRAADHLPALQWDSALAAAAHQHALRMAKANTLSHRFPGEPAMQDRARQAGARFSLIAENVAQGPSVAGLHTQLMKSPPHRANLLDPQLNSVGISVVQTRNVYFAVENFSAAVPRLTLDAQEQEVASQLATHGLRSVNSTADARKTCALDRGWAGQKPAGVLRYETGDLTRLPDDIALKLDSCRYHSAAVGACDARGSGDFTRFRVAILLF
ncbi:MAG: CAP domain-containing protein, partial [Candidatus Acidiferrum sp.]